MKTLLLNAISLMLDPASLWVRDRSRPTQGDWYACGVIKLVIVMPMLGMVVAIWWPILNS